MGLMSLVKFAVVIKILGEAVVESGSACGVCMVIGKHEVERVWMGDKCGGVVVARLRTREAQQLRVWAGVWMLSTCLAKNSTLIMILLLYFQIKELL